MLSPYGEEALWSIARPLEIKASGYDVKLTHIAAVGEWNDTRDLILLFRNNHNPVNVIKTVLSDMGLSTHGKTLFFMSDKGPVIMTFDHQEAICALRKTPVVITRKDYDLRDTVQYFIAGERFKPLRLEDRLELVQRVWDIARDALTNNGRYFGQRVHTGVNELQRDFKCETLLRDVPVVEIHALFREVYRVMNPAIHQAR